MTVILKVFTDISGDCNVAILINNSQECYVASLTDISGDCNVASVFTDISGKSHVASFTDISGD